MKKLSMFIIVLAIAVSFSSISFAGTLSMGVSDLTDGHSEGDNRRCINDGWAVDVGYDFTTWQWAPSWSPDWFKFQLTPGALFTYSNYETAHRDWVGGPETNQRRESALTLLGVAKPGIKIWRVSTYLILGAGVDWMEADEKIDVGYLIEGYGGEVHLYKGLSIGLAHRKFEKADNGHYSYNTLNLSWKF